MSRYMKIIKGNKIVFSVLMGLTACSIIFLIYIFIQGKSQSVQTSNITDDMIYINSMFPGQSFVKQGDNFIAKEGHSYFIENKIPGSFVNKGNNEVLVVVRIPADELSHAEGFYNAYMAVFDNSNCKIVSGVKLFSVDEGSYHIFDSQGISYLFFAGNKTYQGWTNWYGGLWQAGPDWLMKWPKDMENQEYYDFWENRAVEITDDGIRLLERKVIPSGNEGPVIPNYTWEYSQKLFWDKESGSFKAAE